MSSSIIGVEELANYSRNNFKNLDQHDRCLFIDIFQKKVQITDEIRCSLSAKLSTPRQPLPYQTIASVVKGVLNRVSDRISSKKLSSVVKMYRDSHPDWFSRYIADHADVYTHSCNLEDAEIVFLGESLYNPLHKIFHRNIINHFCNNISIVLMEGVGRHRTTGSRHFEDVTKTSIDNLLIIRGWDYEELYRKVIDVVHHDRKLTYQHQRLKSQYYEQLKDVNSLEERMRELKDNDDEGVDTTQEYQKLKQSYREISEKRIELEKSLRDVLKQKEECVKKFIDMQIERKKSLHETVTKTHNIYANKVFVIGHNKFFLNGGSNIIREFPNLKCALIIPKHS